MSKELQEALHEIADHPAFDLEEVLRDALSAAESRRRRRLAWSAGLGAAAAVAIVALVASGQGLVVLDGGDNGTPAASDSTSSDPSTDGADQGPVISTDRALNSYPTALLLGRVTRVGECLMHAGAVVVFPFGTEWRPDESAVLLPDGSRISVDSEVTFSGGLVPITDAEGVVGPRAYNAVASCAESTGALEVALVLRALPAEQ